MTGSVIKTPQDVLDIEAGGLQSLGLAENIYELFARAARQHPDKAAMFALARGHGEDEAREITYGELFGQINQMANALHDLGVGPEDAVTLMMPILPESNVALWAAEVTGIANPINSFLEVEHLAGIMKAAGSKVLITCAPSVSPDPWPKAQALMQMLPDLKAVILYGGEGDEEGVIHWDDAMAGQPADHLKSGRQIDPRDIAAYFHTGGTTGVPKLARHTHQGQILQCWVMTSFLVPDGDNRTVNGLPLFHVGGATCACLAAFSRGATVLLLGAEGFRNPETIRDIFQHTERFQLNGIGAVPAIWSAMLGIPVGDRKIDSLRYGVVGASPLSVDVANAVEAKLGTRLAEGWGMTETHGFATLNPLEGMQKIGSVGIRGPFTELRIALVDQDGTSIRDCRTDEIGSVLVRGPQVIAGYVEDAHNQGAWVDGDWLNTGDLGRIDGDGYLWLTGRAKDVIIRGGHNIDPALIEDPLYQVEGVELAAAVGRPDVRVGELPVAYVQMRAGHAFDADAIAAHLTAHIAERAANPVEIIEMSPMPLTAVGKIFKPALRLDAAQRTFQRELSAAIASLSAAVEVSVENDPSFGVVAKVLTTGAEAAEAAEKCREIMGLHSMHYEITSNGGGGQG